MKAYFSVLTNRGIHGDMTINIRWRFYEKFDWFYIRGLLKQLCGREITINLKENCLSQ